MEFDRNRTREAILFIAERVGPLTLKQLTHLCYLADRKHLEDYGRVITGVTYQLNDGVLTARLLASTIALSDDAMGLSDTLTPFREAELDELSGSDRERLAATLTQHPITNRLDATHYPTVDDGHDITADDIALTLDNNGPLRDHVKRYWSYQ